MISSASNHLKLTIWRQFTSFLFCSHSFQNLAQLDNSFFFMETVQVYKLIKMFLGIQSVKHPINVFLLDLMKLCLILPTKLTKLFSIFKVPSFEWICCRIEQMNHKLSIFLLIMSDFIVGFCGVCVIITFVYVCIASPSFWKFLLLFHSLEISLSIMVIEDWNLSIIFLKSGFFMFLLNSKMIVFVDKIRILLFEIVDSHLFVSQLKIDEVDDLIRQKREYFLDFFK